MKLREILFKPRWQSKDAAVRREAVASVDDPALRAALPQLTREDPDPGVRLAALRRLADPGLAQGLAHDDADPTVRAAAATLWRELLCGAHPSAPPLAERLRLLRAQDSVELIEHLLRHGVESELRTAALERTTRVALLAERALADPDPALRAAALERIDDEGQLERLAEKARRSDKRIQRQARERLEALRIARGEPAAIAARARELCEALERLVHEPGGDLRAPSIEADWLALGDAVPAELATRFGNARRLLEHAREVAQRPLVAEPESVTPSESGLAAADAPAEPQEAIAPASDDAHGGEASPATDAASSDAIDLADVPVDDGTTENVGDASDIADNATAATVPDDADVEARRERRREHLAAFETALRQLETALDAGESAAAHAAHAQMAKLRRESDERLPKGLHARATALEPRYAELSQWQRWADNQRRRQLCDEVESLAGSGLHPDAIATRVREAQAEWQHLDAIEGRGARSASGIGKHFHAACRRALEPARPYFEKRQELRQTHAQQVTALLARIASIDQAAQDVPALLALRRETAAALRDLDRVEPRERKLLAQALKDALISLDARIDAHHAEVETARAALIGEAEALREPADLRAAMSAARELQKRWQAIANGRRRTDQAQWKMFRAALDAVFARADEERNERAAREAERHAQAEALCAELEALAASDAAPERGAVSRIDSAWRALGSRDEALIQRYRAAQTALREAAQQEALARRRVPYDAWLARFRLCIEAEQAADTTALRAAWDAAPPTTVASAELAARFDAALAGEIVAGNADEQRDLLLELEDQAAIEPPESDRERRMQLRLAKLSGHLRGTAGSEPEVEFNRLLEDWTRIASNSDTDGTRRFEVAFETLVRGIAASGS